MTPDTSRHPGRLNGPLVWSSVCIGITVLVVLMLVPPVVRAAVGPSLEGNQVGDRVAKLMAQHEKTAETYQNRFDGRSAFFKPKQPRPPTRRVDEPKIVERPPTDEPKVVEKRKPPYGGPAIKGFVGEQVWFTGNLRVRVGEEKEGVRVVAVSLPRSAQIHYDGWEHEVAFREPVPDDFFGADSSRRNGDLPGITDADGDAATKDAAGRDDAATAADPEETEDEGASTDEEEQPRPGGTGIGGRRTGRNVATPRSKTEGD